jgi:hypothetical protein
MVHAPMCVAAAVLLAAAVPAQETPGAAGAGEVWAPCRFEWPVPGNVTVHKEGHRNGDQAKLRFRLELAPVDGPAVRVRMLDFEFLEMNGRDATSEAARTALAPTMALTQAVPDVVVDARGSFVRVDGLDAMFERFSAYLGEHKGVPAAQRDRLLQTLRTPEMQATIQQASGDDWKTWVGNWVGFDVAPGAEAAADVVLPFMGVELQARATRRNHGAVADHPGHVRLSLTTTASGPAATAAFTAAMERVAAPPGGKAFPKDRVEQVQVEIAAEVVTDSRTLRPLRATRTRTTRIAMKGEAPRERVDRSEFRFEWAPAAPGGR